MTAADRSADRSAADRMFASDPSLAALGIVVVRRDPGDAVAELAVRDDMVNGHGVVHGAFVFAVADTALALAAHEDDRPVLTAGADIEFLRPARSGAVLRATARRVALAGRSGVYDVEVVDDAGELVAVLRGRSRALRTGPTTG